MVSANSQSLTVKGFEAIGFSAFLTPLWLKRYTQKQLAQLHLENFIAYRFLAPAVKIA